MRRRRRALIAGTALIFGLACSPRGAAVRPVHLLFTGDILLSRQVAVEMTATGTSPWKELSARFRRADWVGGNLEGAIGSDRECQAVQHAACFAFPDSAAPLLADAGFRTLTLANNHSADLGAAGRARTIEQLQHAGLMGVDFNASPRFVQINGVTIAVVAIDLIPDAEGKAQRIPSTEVAQKLRLARTLAEVVVVSIHWGKELQEWADGDQHRTAEWLVDHGADLIVGHHPHVIEPPECLHGRPVFFSLGNHVFDQRDPATKSGLIADCRIYGSTLQCGGIGTTTRHGSAVPVVSDTDAVPAMHRCEVPLRPPLDVGGYEIRVRPWSPLDADSGTMLEGRKDGELRWKTRRVDLVTLQRGPTSTDGEWFLFALERHPSTMDHEVALRPHVYAVGDHGLIAKWRGTALAWPLLDAIVDDAGELCALHRGDSFLRPDPTTTATRTMHYQWNGFGFSATKDSTKEAECRATMLDLTGGATLGDRNAPPLHARGEGVGG